MVSVKMGKNDTALLEEKNLFKVSGTTITLTRGDTARIIVGLSYKGSGDEYYPSGGDVVRFAAKKKYKDESPVIYKIIPSDTMILEISPQDTKNLSFGNYVYDIEITYENGDVDTFIERATLKITEEVD